MAVVAGRGGGGAPRPNIGSTRFDGWAQGRWKAVFPVYESQLKKNVLKSRGGAHGPGGAGPSSGVKSRGIFPAVGGALWAGGGRRWGPLGSSGVGTVKTVNRQCRRWDCRPGGANPGGETPVARYFFHGPGAAWQKTLSRTRVGDSETRVRAVVWGCSFSITACVGLVDPPALGPCRWAGVLGGGRGCGGVSRAWGAGPPGRQRAGGGQGGGRWPHEVVGCPRLDRFGTGWEGGHFARGG